MEVTQDYKTSLNIANKLKHNQARLRGVGIYPGDGVYLGYFLEEPDKDGTLGPSPEIHPDQGAFSFARDLKWRFFLVYSLAEKLVRAVERALAGLHQFSIKPGISSQAQNVAWDHLAIAVGNIPFALFPKEMSAAAASVRVTEDQRQLCIKFPDRTRVVYPFSFMPCCYFDCGRWL